MRSLPATPLQAVLESCRYYSVDLYDNLRSGSALELSLREFELDAIHAVDAVDEEDEDEDERDLRLR